MDYICELCGMDEVSSIEDRLPRHLDEVAVYVQRPNQEAAWYPRKGIYLGFTQAFYDEETQHEIHYVTRWKPWR